MRARASKKFSQKVPTAILVAITLLICFQNCAPGFQANEQTSSSSVGLDGLPLDSESTHSCIFNGSNIQHGAKVQAYATSTVSFGQSCSGQMLTCNNGVLAGATAFPFQLASPALQHSVYLMAVLSLTEILYLPILRLRFHLVAYAICRV